MRAGSFIVGMYFILASTVHSAEIRHQQITAGFGLISVSGKLELGDFERFSSAVHQYSKGAVLFSSDGGNLDTGLRIGEEIRLKGFATGVAPNSVCASACALAWLGGVQRYMSSKSMIGFHAAYFVGENGINTSGVGNALVGRYLTRLGLSETAIMFMTSARPEKIAWLSPSDAQLLGIRLDVLEMSEGTTREQVEAKPNPSPSPGKPKTLHYLTGLDPQGDNWLALKSAPDIRSKRLMKLGPDTLLTLIERKGPWLKVQLADGKQGWVSSAYVSCCRSDVAQ